MAEKRVKITRYTREKKAAAKRKAREERAGQKHSILNNMCYVMQEAWHSARGLFIAMLVMLAMQVIHTICATYTDKYVVEFVLDTSSRLQLGIVCVAVITGGQIADFTAHAASFYSYSVGRQYLSSAIYARLMRQKMTTDYENTENPKVNDMLQKAHTAAEGIAGSALFLMKDSLVALLQITAFGGILSMLSPLLVLVIGIPAVIGYFIQHHKMNWVWNMADNWQTFDRQMEYILRAGSDFSRAKDVRIFGMQRWFESLYSRVFHSRQDWNEQQDAWEYRHNVLEQVVGSMGNVAADLYVIYLVMQGSIGAGDFMLYFNSIFMLSQAVRSWCDKYSAYQYTSHQISYARDYFDLPDHTNRGKGRALPPGMCEIEFRNVSYTYAGAEKPTIKNISFRLKKGEKLAMVGLNGAGKTTLIKLMCGLYDPTEGEILLNGVPVDQYNRVAYFRLFGTVFQHISVLPVTIAENISGRKTEEIDYPRLYDCMKKAGIYEKVMSLPERENTRLVKSVYDDATDLSGGQMQKLALARALYKDAPVLLLDEPTAALDPIAEQEMYLSYAQFSVEKTSVFISHRLASTRFCDRILLIADGQIVEEGTHGQLLRAGGTYASLFQMQSNYYKEERNYV